jgi:TRAP-type C4-dicarboxylate transport system substrate-binding protein
MQQLKGTQRGFARRLLVALLLLSAVIGQAQVVKLGSITPSGSPWDDALRQLSGEWARISGGSVDLKIFAGGVVGDEPDMIRKLRIGQLQAAVLTANSLNSIYSGTLAAAAPLLTRTDEEFSYVFKGMQPLMEEELSNRGFTVLMWAEAGWTYFFSRDPLLTLDDLREQRMWVWDAQTEHVSTWQQAGFSVVVLPSTEVLTALQSGMVDAFGTSPMAAASMQWFGVAQHMSELRFAPLFGAVVISDRTWQRVPENLRPRLLAAARQIGADISDGGLAGDRDAIAVMSQFGLTVHPASEDLLDAWEQLIDERFGGLIGTLIDADAYAAATDLVQRYRATTAANN